MSAEHLAHRRRLILDAAIRCFAREGIQGTTMQHVFAESGISPGGVYRYFPSKDDLIVAIAGGVAGRITRFVEVDSAATDKRPISIEDELQRLFALFDSVEEDDDHRRVAIAVWAESLHHQAVATVITGAIDDLTASVAARLALLQESSGLPADVDARAAAQVLVAVLPGYLLQRIWFPRLDTTAFTLAAERLVGARTVTTVASHSVSAAVADSM
ncbi:hypothetical protein OB08_13005 [Microbacterium sp. HJ5]